MNTQNNITDLSGRDFLVNKASVANEMATSATTLKVDNFETTDVLYRIKDIDANERIEPNDAEDSDPNFPDEYLAEESNDDYYDEILLIEIQQQEEENAMIKGYPMPKYN
jgi:hypothetical protein